MFFFVILCAEFISTTIGMNKLLYIKVLVKGMAMLMSGTCLAGDGRDTVVMNKIWNFHRRFFSDTTSKKCNIYMSYIMETKRRNVTL